MKKLLILLLLVAPPAAANCLVGHFEVVPRRPTTDDSIEIVMSGGCSDGCIPIDERVRIDGKTIRIEYDSPAGCILIPVTFHERVSIGRVPAGTYEVVVTQLGDQLARQTITVADAAARAFEVLPAFGGQGTEIFLRGIPGCPGGQCGLHKVRLNGIEIGSRGTPHGLVAIVPLLPAGVYDVTVVAPDGTTFTVPGGFEFRAQADPRDYVRVLFPIAYEGPGAGGSQWTSVNRVSNQGPIGVEPIGLPVLGPGEAKQVGNQSRDIGALVLIPRGLDQYIAYSSHIRDLSRTGQNLGTEIRVVSEDDTANRVVITGVPSDARYRPRLRVYDIDGVEQPVFVRVVTAAGVTTLNANLVPRRSFVCVTIPCEDASYLSLDFNTMLPSLPDIGTVDVTVEGISGRRLWAFVSLTNNETQQVTTYSPNQ